ncbi:MAG: hypothetical protein HC767_07490 [Akkermansiaceae bacterium]|nr:hypothetical protein [Akkermansiaceae bacterium]
MFKDRPTFYALALFLPLFLLPSCVYLAESGPLKKEIKKQNDSYELIEVKSPADLPPAGRSYGQGKIPPRLKEKATPIKSANEMSSASSSPTSQNKAPSSPEEKSLTTALSRSRKKVA